LAKINVEAVLPQGRRVAGTRGLRIRSPRAFPEIPALSRGYPHPRGTGRVGRVSAENRGIGDANPRAASRSLQRARGESLSLLLRRKGRERERERERAFGAASFRRLPAAGLPTLRALSVRKRASGENHEPQGRSLPYRRPREWLTRSSSRSSSSSSGFCFLFSRVDERAPRRAGGDEGVVDRASSL